LLVIMMKACSKSSREVMFQTSMVKTINLFYITLIYIDDCHGGDAEMKPH
jgi:hypothetical protein